MKPSSGSRCSMNVFKIDQERIHLIMFFFFLSTIWWPNTLFIQIITFFLFFFYSWLSILVFYYEILCCFFDLGFLVRMLFQCKKETSQQNFRFEFSAFWAHYKCWHYFGPSQSILGPFLFLGGALNSWLDWQIVWVD